MKEVERNSAVNIVSQDWQDGIDSGRGSKKIVVELKFKNVMNFLFFQVKQGFVWTLSTVIWSPSLLFSFSRETF